MRFPSDVVEHFSNQLVFLELKPGVVRGDFLPGFLGLGLEVEGMVGFVRRSVAGMRETGKCLYGCLTLLLFVISDRIWWPHLRGAWCCADARIPEVGCVGEVL